MDAQGKAKAAGPGDRVTHSRLDAGGISISGSDGHPDYPPRVGDNVGIALAGADRDRMTRIFNGLAEGARSRCPDRAPSGERWDGWRTGWHPLDGQRREGVAPGPRSGWGEEEKGPGNPAMRAPANVLDVAGDL